MTAARLAMNCRIGAHEYCSNTPDDGSTFTGGLTSCTCGCHARKPRVVTVVSSSADGGLQLSCGHMTRVPADDENAFSFVGAETTCPRIH